MLIAIFCHWIYENTYFCYMYHSSLSASTWKSVNAWISWGSPEKEIKGTTSVCVCVSVCMERERQRFIYFSSSFLLLTLLKMSPFSPVFLASTQHLLPFPSVHRHTVVCVYGSCIFVLCLIPSASFIQSLLPTPL